MEYYIQEEYKTAEACKEEIEKASYVDMQIAKYIWAEGWNSRRGVNPPTVSEKARYFLHTQEGQDFLKELRESLYWKTEKDYGPIEKIPHWGNVPVVRNKNPDLGDDWEWKYVVIVTPWY